MTSVDPALRRLASRVLWPGFLGSQAPGWLRRALDDGTPGAVYFGGNADPDDPDRFGRLSQALRAGHGELLLGVDEEGGDVTRLEAKTGSTLPGAAQLGLADDIAATRAVSREIGRRLRRGGATVALAPIADVNTDPRNPIIGVRSFGAHADLVARHVSAAVAGLAEGGVLSCAKHFPGHGDTSVDSHTGLPRVELSLAQLESDHLPPFLAAIDAGVDAIMTSHIVFPELGDEPATVNARVLALTREAGFTGPIVTDALDMAAISATFGLGSGAVRALAAGADLLCIGNPATSGTRRRGNDEDQFLQVRDAVVSAMLDGSLDAARVEEAAERIDRARERVAGRRDAADPQSATIDVDGVLTAAVRIDGPLPRLADERILLDVRRSATGVVVHRSEPFSEAFAARRVAVHGVEAARTARETAATARPSSTLLVLVDALTVEDGQREIIAAVRAERPDAVVVDVGVPGTPGAPSISTSGGNRVTAEWVRRTWGDAS